MSLVWIYFGIITIILGLSAEGYTLYKLSINLDSFIAGYISFNPNFADNIAYIPKISIKDILFNLNIINFISIFTTITLLLQVLLKFHFNKYINSIYIWLSLLVLILTLAFAAHTYGDLYTHIDGYVNMYINCSKK
jgi:hypothetical protein